MSRSRMARLAALEAGSGSEGLNIDAALNALSDLDEQRGTFATVEDWLAFMHEREAAWVLAPALVAALPADDDAGLVSRADAVEEAERVAWRRDRARYVAPDLGSERP